jgi:hypothetical protein
MATNQQLDGILAIHQTILIPQHPSQPIALTAFPRDELPRANFPLPYLIQDLFNDNGLSSHALTPTEWLDILDRVLSTTMWAEFESLFVATYSRRTDARQDKPTYSDFDRLAADLHRLRNVDLLLQRIIFTMMNPDKMNSYYLTIGFGNNGAIVSDTTFLPMLQSVMILSKDIPVPDVETWIQTLELVLSTVSTFAPEAIEAIMPYETTYAKSPTVSDITIADLLSHPERAVIFPLIYGGYLATQYLGTNSILALETAAVGAGVTIILVTGLTLSKEIPGLVARLKGR